MNPLKATLWTRLSLNKERGIGEYEWGTGKGESLNGESLKAGIFKVGNL